MSATNPVNHQNIKLVEGHPPKDYTSAAADANYISMKGYTHLTIVIQTGAWAAGTAAVTINKATDVSETGETGATFTEMYTNDGATTTDTLTKTTVTANTFNLDVANAMYIIEIDPAEHQGYDCFQLAVATPGANADLYSSLYILSGCRYAQGESPVPTALTD